MRYFRMPVFMMLGLLASCSGGSGHKDFNMVVFHTNDRHSHFLGLPNGDYDPANTGDGTVGGAARWMKIVEDERAANPEVLLLDAGDFTMGTMLVAADDNTADINFLKQAGYAAADLGNHEFDWGEARLAEMINAAGQPTVPLLASNIHFNPDDTADDSLEALYGQQGQAGKSIFPYITLTTPGGTKVGIFGLLGLEAASVSNARAATFSRDMDEMAQTAQQVIDTLRNEQKVDLVICLAHLGIIMDGQTPSFETIELARKTEGIDLILSGHVHTAVDHLLSIKSEAGDGSWTTYTMEAGCYGRFLGRYELVRKGGQRSFTGTLMAIDDSLPVSQDTTDYINGLIADIVSSFLPSYPILPDAGAFLSGEFGQVLTHSSFSLPRVDFENGNLGYLVADAMREATGAEMAFASNGGDLRDSLPVTQGNQINLQDAFIVTPLGTGPDKRLGYPLTKFRLKLKEILLLMEATICDMGQTSNDYMIDLSGLRAVYDSNLGGTYNCVSKLTQYQNIDESDAGTLLFDKADGGFKVDQDTLVEVCTSSYIASMMTNFNVYPKDENGQNMTVEDAIVKDAQGHEVKLWYSVAKKLTENDPIPDLYNDAYPPNPIGPYWRRAWDLKTHPCNNDHPYCH
ncbi:MAG TPA: metallophosphoesterase [Myxococcota bacterium]|nr:metallophosphoesterase [Myxococcota bacterium]